LPVLRNVVVIVIALIGAGFILHAFWYALPFYLWAAYFRPQQWVWEGPLATANLSLYIGMVVVAAIAVSRARWQFNLRTAMLLLFVGQALLSTLVSPKFDYSWPYWTEFAKNAVVCYAIVVLVDDVSKFRTVLVVICLSLGFEASRQGWFELFKNPGMQNANTHPMLGDNNGVALGLLMLVPMLTTVAATAKSTWSKSLYFAATIGVVYRAVVTYSRGGFLAFVALGLVYFVRSRSRIAVVAAAAVIAGVIVPVLPDTFWQRIGTVTTVDDSRMDASARGRLHFWAVALQMSSAHPLVGVGHNAFNVTYDQYDDSEGAFGRERSAHSAWLGVLAELGYPGLILLVSQLILAFRACATAKRVARLNPDQTVLAEYAFAIEGALLVYIVGATFLPAQYGEMLWHLIALSAALNALALKAMPEAERQPWQVGPGGTRVVGAGAWAGPGAAVSG
jgi:putative inorganic carbon (hco3(-)) transporter